MNSPSTLVFKYKAHGILSQTGLAAHAELGDVNYRNENPGFDEIRLALETDDCCAVLPIWNSHEGEIKKAKAFELLFNGKALLFRIWPKPIQFECLWRPQSTSDQIREITSIIVAKKQCSRFLQDINNPNFIEAPSTNDAYASFRDNEKINAALCAPGQNVDSFVVFKEHAENPVNFTTFLLLAPLAADKWDDAKWGELWRFMSTRKAVYQGVQMPIRTATSSDDQKEFLDDLTLESKTANDIPRIVFVARTRTDTCGLLVEGTEAFLSDAIVMDETYSSEITIFPLLGRADNFYPQRVETLLKDYFHINCTSPFLRHIGIGNTCMYACPPIGLLTHGYEHDVVEPVVRQVICKYFELFGTNRISATNEQELFFNHYMEAYREDGANFIQFEDIGL